LPIVATGKKLFSVGFGGMMKVRFNLLGEFGKQSAIAILSKRNLAL